MFCTTEHGVRWQLVPHRDFLPRDLANRYKRIRAAQPQPVLPSEVEEDTQPPIVSSQAADPASLEEQGVRLDEASHEQEIQRNADDILDRILQEIAEEVSSDEDNQADSSSSEASQGELPAALNDVPALLLPEDLQEPDELQMQAAFWTSLLPGRGAPSSTQCDPGS